MITHNLLQGSPQWLAYRAEHFNASDAPAMMGASPYKSRTELLHEMHTGMAREVDAGTQKRFDDGHRFEALARGIAEEIVGEDLFPVTGSSGKLSASFDGITMFEDVIFEHKTLNAEIRAAETVADLGAHYRIQMEQQMLVSGAEKALFMGSRWSDSGELLEEKHFWYEGDPELRASIVAGWDQFAADLASYAPVEKVAKAAAEVIMALPALVVQTRGEVVRSNLPEFQAAASAFIARIKTDLKTDEDFANAEDQVKFCDRAEKDLEHTKSAVLAQASTIDDVMRTIDNIKEQLRTKRLALTKLVDSKKLQIKEGILATAKLAYADHVAALEAEIKPLRLPAAAPDFAGAMKNKRTLASLQDAVDTLLASAKIATNTTAADYRAKQAWCKENAAGHGALFADMAAIITKPMEDFQLVVTTRVDAHLAAEKAKEDALRAQIAEQEKAKAEAAAAAKLAAERKADADRLAAEQAAAKAAADGQERQRAAEAKRIADAEAASNAEAVAKQVAHTRDTALAAARQSIASAAAANVAEHAVAIPASAAPEIDRTASFYGDAPATRTAPANLFDQADVVDATFNESEANAGFIIDLADAYGIAPTALLDRLEKLDFAAIRAELAIAA